jgi:hypothetical protein
MAKGIYLGIGGVARKVKQPYVGINGVARKVTKGYIGVGGVARLFYSGSTPINTLSVGDVVQVAESGNYIDYIIVQIGTPASSKYSNADGYWLLRKQVELNGAFSMDSDGDSPANYTSSKASGYIRAKETLYYNRYGSYLKSIILRPTLPYYYFSASTADAAIGSVTVNNVFHLGLAEVGSWFGESSTTEMKLAYFKNTASGRDADPLRIAYNGSGSACSWWTRDAGGDGAYQPGFIANSGRYSSSTAFTVYYRPCFIVPKTIMIEDLLR